MGAGRAGRARQIQDAPPTCGQLLQRYRVLAGLTQEELAERAGYSANYIGKLEQDQRELSAAAADRLAEVLDLADQDRAALRAARERRQDGRELPGRLLAGRDAEMTPIRQLLAGAGPPVLLLAGEPGMGKTRLLEEAALRAAGGGWSVARGGCLRRAHDAYAPLSGALEDALARLPAGQRAEALRQAGRVDLLLPELAPPSGPGPGDGGAAAGVRPEQQRRLLVSSAGRLLRAVAGRPAPCWSWMTCTGRARMRLTCWRRCWPRAGRRRCGSSAPTVIRKPRPGWMNLRQIWPGRRWCGCCRWGR